MDELTKLHRRVAELEALEAERLQVEQELLRRTEDLALINKLNDAANRGSNLREIVDLLSQETKSIFSSYATSLYVLDEDKNLLILQNLTLPEGVTAQIERLIGSSIPSVQIPLVDSQVYRGLLQRGEGCIINDPKAIQEMMADCAATIDLPGPIRGTARALIPQIHHVLAIKSVISVPLVSAGEAVGLLEISHREPFSPTDLDRLEIIGRQVTTIIQRQRADEALRSCSERLEDLVAERTAELGIAQQRSLNQERLSALGQLAASLGHELRGPLGAITAAAYFLLQVLEPSNPDVQEVLEILEREVARSERIISSLLDYARFKLPVLEPVDVNHMLIEILIGTQVPDHVKLIKNFDPGLPVITADPDQLEQVFGNIIHNAIQAMSLPQAEPKAGRLLIETSSSPTHEVIISITDSGVGIPAEHMDQIFEPLFTTKAKGIGLGLALVRSLVEGHDGTINVASKVGQGTTFTVTLPREVAMDREE